MTRPKDPLFDERIADWFEGDPDRAPGDALDFVLAAFPSVPQQRVVHRPPWSFPRPSMPTRIAAAVVVGVLAVGGAVYVTRPGQPALGGPAATSDPNASPSHAAVAPPSATPTAAPTATPRPTPTPILWTQASLNEDWPAPVRAEPAGGGTMLPIVVTRVVTGKCPDDCGVGTDLARHVDPSDDIGSDLVPWVDIRELSVGTHGVTITLVSNLPPDVHPTEQWIAYGVVFDDDRDGVPDRRFGMDNSPRTVEGHHQVRDWITDLHTGRTLVSINDRVGGTETSDGVFMDVTFPGDGVRYDGAHFTLGGEAAGGGYMGTSLVHRPFYAWASVIQDGKVVATDYAPDVRWLDTSLKETVLP